MSFRNGFLAKKHDMTEEGGGEVKYEMTITKTLSVFHFYTLKYFTAELKGRQEKSIFLIFFDSIS